MITESNPTEVVDQANLCMHFLRYCEPSFSILMNWWYGWIASWDIVSWWYLPRIWPSVTDMQHYYHAGYPTDDWHLAYMFSLVYFSVEVCLVGLFPHSVNTRRDPCVRVYYPSRWVPPSRENKIRTGGDPAQFDPSEGGFELTYGSACIIGW